MAVASGTQQAELTSLGTVFLQEHHGLVLNSFQYGFYYLQKVSVASLSQA